MEIKIDTRDIMGEEGDVRQEIINLVVSGLRKSSQEKINTYVEKVVNEKLQSQIEKQVKQQIAVILKKALDYEFVEVDKWGDSKETFTIRKRIVHIFKEETVLKGRGGYRSDKNCATEAFEGVIVDEFNKMKAAFSKLIDYDFLTKCHDYAVDAIKERLKIKA